MTDSSSPQTPLISSVSKSCALSPIWHQRHTFFLLKLYGEAGSRSAQGGGGGGNFHPESDEQTGNWGGGRGVRVQGNRQRQGRAKQRNETSYLHLSSFYTYSRDQGTGSFYKLLFSSIKLYKIIHFTVCTRIMIQQRNQKTDQKPG